ETMRMGRMAVLLQSPWLVGLSPDGPAGGFTDLELEVVQGQGARRAGLRAVRLEDADGVRLPGGDGDLAPARVGADAELPLAVPQHLVEAVLLRGEEEQQLLALLEGGEAEGHELVVAHLAAEGAHP